MEYNTPAYFFNINEFKSRIHFCKSRMPQVPLTYSIKANPFLLRNLPDDISYVEVCSPGELQICKKWGISGDRIIYSGVNKEYDDVKEAIAYGVYLVTAESLKHIRLEQAVSKELGVKQKVILRLSSGNQFGMSEDDLHCVFEKEFDGIEIIGLHYYSGTQKKTRQVKKDLERLGQVLEELKIKFDFLPQIVEYGPGTAVNYFVDSMESDEEFFVQILPYLNQFSEKYPLGIEMGRFLASSCGTYATKVVDIKRNDGVNYVICDGGIHQIKYYGQALAMQVPEITVVNPVSEDEEIYCLCGSLCTVSDVLVRDVKLKMLQEGSILLFSKCGAYSVMEGCSLFLSREIPSVYLIDNEGDITNIRETHQTFSINS